MKLFDKVLKKAFTLVRSRAQQPSDKNKSSPIVEGIQYVKVADLPIDKPLLWKHLTNPDYYRILFPPEVADPSKNQPGYMATVIENIETGEVRVVPYLKVPVTLHAEMVIDPEAKTSTRRQWIEPKLPEN